jgi:hypothetical protein
VNNDEAAGQRRMNVSSSRVAAAVTNAFDPFGVPKYWSGLATRTQVELWLDKDARAHTQDDGTTACGRYYQHLKLEMQQSINNIMEPFRSMAVSMLMGNGNLQELMRSERMAEQFRLVDSIIRERYPNERGTLYRPEYNHHFLSEDSTGKIVAMDDASIVKLFAQRGKTVDGRGEVFPHIIITTSHAQGETLSDVTSITHGIESMARDSEKVPLPHGYVDTGITSGQTLMLYACDVEKSPMLNGAELLDRINELKHIRDTGKVERNFRSISPGAKRIAKLMLKCMVEDPEAIDTRDDRGMRDIVEEGDAPLRLKEDAAEIAHHFQLIGYSKGGNVVSDAMRYLVSELTAKNAQGQDVFQMHPKSPTVNGEGTGMNTSNVSKIVRNIAVMALASVEMGMDQYYKDHGVRRVAINSDKDLISAHHNYEGSLYDERWIIQGVKQHMGHAPQDMMGTRDGHLGYGHGDKRVDRRLKEFFAPNFGKAAIGRVFFDAHAAEGVVRIETATGTMGRQIEPFMDTIRTEVAKALKIGPDSVTCSRDGGVITLTCKRTDFTKSTDALHGLKKAFEALRKDHVKGLVITQSIIEPNGDIDKQIKSVGGRWGGRG